MALILTDRNAPVNLGGIGEKREANREQRIPRIANFLYNGTGTWLV